MIRAIVSIGFCLGLLSGCGPKQSEEAVEQTTTPETLVLGGFEEGASFEIEAADVTSQSFEFSSLGEAEKYVRRILDTSVLAPSFKLVSTERVNNAAAVFVRESSEYWLGQGFQVGDRVIAYNPVWIKSWVGSDEFKGIVLLAHELGHHLNGHALAPGARSSPPIELESDRYAGCAVARLDGTEDDASRLFASLPEEGTATHPPRDERVKVALEGYRKCFRGAGLVDPPIAPGDDGCTLEKLVGYWKCKDQGKRECTANADASVISKEPDGRYIWSDGKLRSMYIDLQGQKLFTTKDGKRAGPFSVENCSKVIWKPNRHWDEKEN